MPLVYLGRADEFLDACANSLHEEERKAPLVWSRIIGCLAQLGRIAEAQESLDEYVKRFSVFDGDAPALLLSDLLEAAVLLADESLARRLSDLLASTKFMVVPSDREIRCLGRHLGRAFALRGEADEARVYYDRTLEVCDSIGFQPEIALTRLDLAELLFGHFPDERDAASELLNLAIADFRQMRMQPSLERALRHRGLLEA